MLIKIFLNCLFLLCLCTLPFIGFAEAEHENQGDDETSGVVETADVISRQSVSFAPADGKVLLVIGQDKGTIDQYVETTGIIPAGFMLYTSIQDLEGLDAPADRGSGIQDAQHLIDKYPNTVLQVGLYMVNALEGITNGSYDSNIDKLSEWATQVDRPIYLRIGYEFDGSHNHYDPEAYVKGYRYIVDRMRKNGVDNVVFVWHSFAAGLDAGQLMKYYPGDDYVDWFGISYFRQAEHLILPMVELAKQHQKPLMIAEATPMGLKTSYNTNATASTYLWETYYHPLFDFAQRHNVKMISYINTDWDSQPMWQDQNFGDARIQANDLIKTNWLDEINKPTYLKASPDLFEQLGYSQAD
jgi:hypothetical protein